MAVSPPLALESLPGVVDSAGLGVVVAGTADSSEQHRGSQPEGEDVVGAVTAHAGSWSVKGRVRPA